MLEPFLLPVDRAETYSGAMWPLAGDVVFVPGGPEMDLCILLTGVLGLLGKTII